MTRRPVVGVLALQGDVREHARALAACDAEAVEVRTPAHLADVDGIVLPGGESTTMSKLLDFQGLLNPLRERISAGMPVYGSCAGMILLASTILDGRADQVALGAIDMVVRRNAFGAQVDSFEAEIQVTGCGDAPVSAVFIRAPWVESVGEKVEVLSRVVTPTGADRIVAVKQGAALATSFHPELTSDVRVHALFVEMVRQSA
jgi:5'-phosphate synthase pdxT subunit